MMEQVLSHEAILSAMVWLLTALAKSLTTEKFNRYLPALALVLGAGVGVFVAWHYGGDWVQYMVAGGFSGMSAVGVNEVGKRFMKEMKVDE